MTKEKIEEYRRRIGDGMFITAYEILVREIDEYGITDELKSLSKELSEKIRVKAYLSSYKKDEKSAIELGALLKLVIKINGESSYGEN
jgi:hypothetical protein